MTLYVDFQQCDLWDGSAQVTGLRSAVGQLAGDWVLAPVALLGHISLEAVHAVNILLMGGEARFCQRLAAGVAPETVRVPGLLLVADPSRGDGLMDADTHTKSVGAVIF